MIKKIIDIFQKIRDIIKRLTSLTMVPEQHLLITGRLLSELIKTKQNIANFSTVEFKVFSQWGDDGIIQWLIHNIDLPHQTFIEFGVEDYQESNTRFLMMNDNWSGLVIDASTSNIDLIIHSDYFWKYNLQAQCMFVDIDNINDAITASNLEKDVGILHIDIDGNDYWIWQAITVISPIIVIIEYNSIFGIDRAISIPYDRQFYRTNAHYSNLYYGASLRALCQLSTQKGYTFIGCNSAGNNAYFVRRDRLNSSVRETTVEAGYVCSQFRDSRDQQGNLTYLVGDERLAVIKGLPVYNVETHQMETL